MNRFWKFADDSKMMGRVDSSQGIDLIKKDLKELEDCTKRWQMPLNASKCKVMHVGRDNPSVDYEINREKLQVVELEVDLGVVISKDLKREGQCSKSVKKANQILGLIARTFISRDKKMMLALYKSLVSRPI